MDRNHEIDLGLIGSSKDMGVEGEREINIL